MPGTRLKAWITTVASVPALLGIVLLGLVSSIASAQGAAAGGSCPPGYTLVVRTCAPPGTPRPDAVGTRISGFGDTATPWGRNLINRWQIAPGDDPWSAPSDVGTPWPSGGGIWQIRTPFGPGFRFIATSEMTVASGGKKSEIADIGNLVEGEGHTETWSGMVMFPKAGNPTGFPREPDWNVFFDFHSNYGVPLQMGIDTGENRSHIYLRSLPYNEQRRKARSRSRLVFDRWYSWRITLKWSSGSDGFLKWWLNDRLLADWTGPTLAQDEVPYLQFGFYSEERFHNEVVQAALRKT